MFIRAGTPCFKNMKLQRDFFQKIKVGQNGTPETAGAKPKGKLEYFNATVGMYSL